MNKTNNATLLTSLLIGIWFTVCSTPAIAQVSVDAKDSTLISIYAGSGFIVPLKNYNSYCCTIYPQGPNTNAGLSATIENRANPSETVQGTLRGDMEPAVSVNSESSETDTTPVDNRVCVIATNSVDYKFPIQSAVGGEEVKVACENTTLNGGFNTNGTPLNFLECSNQSDANIDGKIYATDFFGTPVISGADISILAGRRSDFDIHSKAGPNKYGRLWVVHNGTKQALHCSISRYSEDLTLRSTVPLS